MTKFLPVLWLILLSTTGLSLGETNCSDALGELRRVEKEIWGANDIRWYYKDMELKPDSPIWLDGTDDSIVQVSGVEGNGTYYMDITVHFASGEAPITKTVLCESWSNSAID